MGEHPQSYGSGCHPRLCAQSMRNPTSRDFYRHFTLSVCGSLMLQKNPPLCPFQIKIKSHAWIDWRPVALTPIFSKCFEKVIRDYICSVLPASLDPLQFAYRSNCSTDDAIAFLHTCTLLSPTWKIRTPMWECCSWTIVQHLHHSAWHTGCEAPDSGTKQISVQLDPGLPDSRGQVVRMGNNTSSPLILNTGAPQGWSFSAHSCTPWTHMTVQPHTAPTSSSNLLTTQRW